jgi:hypothetical protein
MMAGVCESIVVSRGKPKKFIRPSQRLEFSEFSTKVPINRKERRAVAKIKRKGEIRVYGDQKEDPID